MKILAGKIRVCVLLAACVPLGAAAQQQTDRQDKTGWGGSTHFRIVQLADGVWAAAHEDHGYAVSNAGIIDLGDRTIIFDTFLTPAAARDLRAAAEMLTGRVATLVVNSHAHNDHIRGNQVFLHEAEIIATGYTMRAIATDEPDQVAYEKANAPAGADKQKAILDDPRETGHAEAKMWRDYYEGILASHEELQTTSPTVSFKGTLVIRGSKRTAEIRATGRGHTEDDAVLFLPQDRIAFLGDLHFVERHPYLGDGWAPEWAEVLRDIYTWGVGTVVPGHGPVSSATTLITMAEYIETLSRLVEEHMDAGGTEEELSTLAMPEAYANWWYGRFFPMNLRSLYRAAVDTSVPWISDVVGPQYVAVRVSNVDEAIAWYVAAFGVAEVGGSQAEDGLWRIANLKNKDLFVEIIRDNRALAVDRARGFFKTGFGVRDVGVIAARVERATGDRPKIVEDANNGIRILQLLDPDGNIIQLSSPLK